MGSILRAIEATGVIEERRNIRLDEPIPIVTEGRVRVIIFVDDESDIGETEWHRAASRNPAFAFLLDPGEDIYSSEDGKPFYG